MNLLVGVLSKSYDHHFERAQELFVRERANQISLLRTRPWVRHPPAEWGKQYLWFAKSAERPEPPERVRQKSASQSSRMSSGLQNVCIAVYLIQGGGGSVAGSGTNI